jgi:hypothetical protein
MRQTLVRTALRIPVPEVTRWRRRHAGRILCVLTVVVTAIAGCGIDGTDGSSAAPPPFKRFVFIKGVGAIPAGVTFKQGRTTITAGGQTDELEYRRATSDRPVSVVLWAHQSGNTTSEFFIVFAPDGTMKAYANGTPSNARGCSIRISRSDATALAGTFDCPNTRPAATGSFSATQ